MPQPFTCILGFQCGCHAVWWHAVNWCSWCDLWGEQKELMQLAKYSWKLARHLHAPITSTWLLLPWNFVLTKIPRCSTCTLIFETFRYNIQFQSSVTYLKQNFMYILLFPSFFYSSNDVRFKLIDKGVMWPTGIIGSFRAFRLVRSVRLDMWRSSFPKITKQKCKNPLYASVKLCTSHCQQFSVHIGVRSLALPGDYIILGQIPWVTSFLSYILWDRCVTTCLWVVWLIVGPVWVLIDYLPSKFCSTLAGGSKYFWVGTEEVYPRAVLCAWVSINLGWILSLEQCCLVGVHIAMSFQQLSGHWSCRWHAATQVCWFSVSYEWRPKCAGPVWEGSKCTSSRRICWGMISISFLLCSLLAKVGFSIAALVANHYPYDVQTQTLLTENWSSSKIYLLFSHGQVAWRTSALQTPLHSFQRCSMFRC